MKSMDGTLEEIKQRANSLSLMTTSPLTGDKPFWISSPFECEICKDEEWVLIQEFNDSGMVINEFARQCECVAGKRVKRLMASSKITEEFQRKGFGNFEQNGRPEIIIQAFQTAFGYVVNFEENKKLRQNSIALLGRPGCGKTHLLMAVANKLLAKGVEVIYFPWVEGFNEIKDDFDKMEERMNKLRRCEVLYIDDMFKGRKEPTEFQLEQLFGIINYRYLENKPIMISSEKTMTQICEFDEGIGSRINEMCRDYKVTLTGGIELNYRLQ